MSCRAELCTNWTGHGCACEVLDLDPEPTCPAVHDVDVDWDQLPGGVP